MAIISRRRYVVLTGTTDRGAELVRAKAKSADLNTKGSIGENQ
jgi:hypothetical protein